MYKKQNEKNKALMITGYVKNYRFPCDKDLFILNLNTLIFYSGGKLSTGREFQRLEVQGKNLD